MKFVVAGTGRCGTLRTAGALTHLGLPTTHEAGRTSAAMDDVSCWCAPYLDPEGGYRILHLVRAPLACIASLARNSSPGNPSLKTFSDAITEKLGVERDAPGGIAWAAWFYLHWNRMIERVAHERHRVEDDTIFGALVPEATPAQIRAAMGRAHRHQGPNSGVPVSWDSIPDHLAGPLRAMATDYGYEGT